MVAQVPIQGVPTLYPYIGDLVAWLSIAGFVLLAGWAAILSPRDPNTPKDNDELADSC
jgi:hypothetical protein